MAYNQVCARPSFTLMTALGLGISIAIVAATLSLAELGLYAARAQFIESGFRVIQISYSTPENHFPHAKLPESALEMLRTSIDGAEKIMQFSVGEAKFEDKTFVGDGQIVSGSPETMQSVIGELRGRLASANETDAVCWIDSDRIAIGAGRPILLANIAFHAVGSFNVTGPLLQTVSRTRPVLMVPPAVFSHLPMNNVHQIIQVSLVSDDWGQVRLAIDAARGYFQREYPALAVKVSSPWETIQETKNLIDTIIRMTLWMGFIIASMSCVAMANAILLSIRQRQFEIGVRLAIGARPNDIAFQLIGEAIMIALIGIGLGWAAALLGTFLWCAYADWPWQPVQGALAKTALMGFITAITASFYPALQAARVDPVEVLRG